MAKHLLSLLSLIIPLFFVLDGIYRLNEPQVYFSPNGGCSAEVVKELDKARKSIVVQAYGFTSKDIADAIIGAKARGVDVCVIMDGKASGGKGSKLTDLKQGGVTVLLDKEHAIAHNKVMVIDNYVVLTGSYNWTESAEKRNAENLLIIKNRALARKYMANFLLHKGHSQ